MIMKPILTFNGQKIYPATKIENVLGEGKNLAEILAELSDNVAVKDEHGNSYAISVERGAIVLKKIEPTQVVGAFRLPDGLVLNSGASYQIIPVADVRNGAYKYTTSNESVATVSDEGVVMGVGSGEATITVTSGNATREMGVVVGAQVSNKNEIEAMVTRTPDAIEIINPVDTLRVGDERVLYAVGINNTGLRYDITYQNFIKFESTNPAVASVEFGVVTANKAGSCNIVASNVSGSVTKVMPLTVTPAIVESIAEGQIYRVDDHKFSIYNNGTHSVETTTGIAEALNYALEQGYRKIVFNAGTYLMNADYLPNAAAIEIPSGLIVDFNGATIRIEEGAKSSSGYTLLAMTNCVDTQLLNATFLGENYERNTLLRKEANRTLTIRENCRNILVENCRFAWATGFNVGLSFSRSWANSLSLNNIEAGGLNNSGVNVSADYTFRTINYIDVSKLVDSWCLGNYHGYQTQYLRSRLYDIYFFDASHNLLFFKKNCYDREKYYFPEGIKPTYCKIAFFQEEAPTQQDPDYFGVTHIVDMRKPERVTFRDCTFDHAISTGLSPQGGNNVVVENCHFEDNGYQDPYSHIDWEDGRQNSNGHIVKGSTFVATGAWGTYSCQIINGYSRNIVLKDNVIKGGMLRTLDECVYPRIFHNSIIGTKVSLASKLDAVYASNFQNVTPTDLGASIDGCTFVNIENKTI